MTSDMPLLEVAGLRTHFFTRAGVVKAVDDVSFTVRKGEVLGLVGESGSGKSMTGYSIMGLVDPPGRIVDGTIRLAGRDLRALSPEELRQLARQPDRDDLPGPDDDAESGPAVDAQMVETILAHERVTRREALERSREALVKVGIPSPDERLAAYPHQFSGGMRQRVAIAIALLNNPDLIIADEPTTALDVTIQGQILFEMQKLTRETGAAMIWITHDLSVVAGLADHVCVMYAGRIVEQGSVFDVLSQPRHPYTQGLLDSVPSRSVRGARLKQIPGMTPSVLDLPAGCAFRERCARASGALRDDAGDAAAGVDGAGAPSAATIRSSRRRRHERSEREYRGAKREGGPVSPPLVELQRVSKRFVKSLDVAARIGNLLGAGLQEEIVHAVDGVDLAIRQGEVVGLVGESGCGKSTLGRLAVGLLPLSAGERRWQGTSLAGLAPEAARAQQLKMQMIFQDPYASLNPRMRVVDIVGEAPVAHGMVAAGGQSEYVAAAVEPRRARRLADAALSAPVLRRPAGADRHRARARGEARVPGVRRIGRGARRVDPGAGAESLHGAARGARPHLSFHQPRPGRRRAHQRPRRHHVPRPRRRVRAHAGALRARRTIRTRRRCWPRRARSSRTSARSCRSRARFRRRSRRRRAAISIRAARSAMAICRTTAPALREIAPGRWSSCHLNDG